MCSKLMARLVLLQMNILFFTAGGLLFSFGIVGVANPTALTNFLSSIPGVKNMAIIINIPAVVVSSSIFMIVLGSIMLVFGFFGFFGVICGAKWMLFVYIILLVAVIVTEIILIIFAAVQPGQLETYIQKAMYTSLTERFEPMAFNDNTDIFTLPPDIVATAWVSMQIEVACCGSTNSTDYSTFTWKNTFNVSGVTLQALVPPSCCKMKDYMRRVPPAYSDYENFDGCMHGTTGLYNTKGCHLAVRRLMEQYSYISIGICCAVIGIELVAMVCAIYLWKQKEPEKQYA